MTEIISVYQGILAGEQKISYSKDNKIFSIDIFNFKFVGQYKKATKIARVLDDLHNLLIDLPLERKDYFIMDLQNSITLSEKGKVSALIAPKGSKKDFTIGIRFVLRLYSGKPGRPREVKFCFPHKIKLIDMIQQVMSQFNLEEQTLDLFNVSAEENVFSGGDLFGSTGNMPFEQIIVEYGNVFGLRMKEPAEAEHPDIYERVYEKEADKLMVADMDDGLRRQVPKKKKKMGKKGGKVSAKQDISEDISEIIDKPLPRPMMEASKDEKEKSSPSPPPRILAPESMSKSQAQPSTPKAQMPSPVVTSTEGAPGGGMPARADFRDSLKDMEKRNKKEAPAEEGKRRELSISELKSKEESMDDEEFEATGEAGEIAQTHKYNINMGLQYYPVMMVKRPYLLYVHFSHKELKIQDEEGKVVFETHFVIETTKDEPPVVDLQVGGEGFEVHPLTAQLMIDKDAVNPPVMIFSVLPLKTEMTKEEKKFGQKRFLNVLVHFEGQNICHVVLAITVQPKHFRLDIGPVHLNVNKGTAIAISVASFSWAIFSVILSILTFDPSSLFTDMLTGFIPSLASIVFVALFTYELISGVFPLKQQWSDIMNFDQSSAITK